jgi:hypothetical protein
MEGSRTPTIFAHAVGDRVRIVESQEFGTVIGRAEYDYAEPQYLVRYRAADGRAVELWWTQGALAPGAMIGAVPAAAGLETKANDVTRRTLAMVDHGGGVDFAANNQAIANGIQTAAEMIDSDFTANASDTGGGGGVDEAKPTVAEYDDTGPQF